MLELTPLDFTDSGKDNRKNVPYAIFMIVWAAFLFFDKEIIGGLLVLAAWIVPMLIDVIFPGFYESKTYKAIIGTMILIAMAYVAFWIYRDFLMIPLSR